MTVKAIPEGFGTITPTLTIDGAARAIEFYKKAFGAEEVSRAPDPSGQKIWHAPLRVGNKSLGKPFFGLIDDLRLYSCALSRGEIERLAIHYRPRVMLAGVVGKPSKEEAEELREYFQGISLDQFR